MEFIPLEYQKPTESQLSKNALEFYMSMDKRRSVRSFSDADVPKEVIDHIILTASSAPSGAHKQPWTFCAISNPELKKAIREAAEKEEYDNYHGRMSDDWLEDLAPLRTDWHKPFLEIAPWLIVLFRKVYDLEDGQKSKNYYVSESVGIAAGFLLSAIHQSGLVSLTHTPSPMNFLQKLLNRPENEKPFLLIPVGYPEPDVEVPDLKRKSLNEVAEYYL